MPFENTPDDLETGTFEDSTANTDRTEEVWIEADGKAYGFQIIPKEEVPWRKKSEAVQNAVEQGGGFDAVAYYEEILSYMIQETSFGAEERLQTWLTSASTPLLEQLEEHAPAPQGEMGQNPRADAALELVEEYLNRNGSESDSLVEFREFLKEQAEGDEGK